MSPARSIGGGLFVNVTLFVLVVRFVVQPWSLTTRSFSFILEAVFTVKREHAFYLARGSGAFGRSFVLTLA
jgi:hypothetical protein